MSGGTRWSASLWLRLCESNTFSAPLGSWLLDAFPALFAFKQDGCDDRRMPTKPRHQSCVGAARHLRIKGSSSQELIRRQAEYMVKMVWQQREQVLCEGVELTSPASCHVIGAACSLDTALRGPTAKVSGDASLR